MRRWYFVVVTLVAACGFGSHARHRAVAAEAPREAAYRSPYQVKFTTPVEALVGDMLQTERGDPRLEAEIAFPNWYTHHTRERSGSWGPHPRTYPPAQLTGWSVQQKRERVIAVAMRFIGYGYQHHHIPDWDPPRSWPWKQTCAGQNGKGVDCSNFTGFVYNLGFGVRLNTEVGHQAEEHHAEGPGRERTWIRRIELPENYNERQRVLHTGDLVFIRNRSGKVSHVVIWVGAIGRSPDGVPLIMDSHGEDVRDSDGKPIPCGIHLRPFRKNSWYNGSASHAARLIED